MEFSLATTRGFSRRAPARGRNPCRAKGRCAPSLRSCRATGPGSPGSGFSRAPVGEDGGTVIGDFVSDGRQSGWWNQPRARYSRITCVTFLAKLSDREREVARDALRPQREPADAGGHRCRHRGVARAGAPDRMPRPQEATSAVSQQTSAGLLVLKVLAIDGSGRRERRTLGSGKKSCDWVFSRLRVQREPPYAHARHPLQDLSQQAGADATVAAGDAPRASTT